MGDGVKVINAILKIVYSYVFAGVANFWLGVSFLYLKDGFLNFDLINTNNFMNSVFLWPVSSFRSGYLLFGEEGGQIMRYFSLSAVLLFLGSVFYLFKKDFPDTEIHENE